VAILLVGALAGCSSTVTGLAVKAPESDSDGASVALMDTGAYETAASHPYGTAGADRSSQAVLESQRLADFTVGPWQVDDKIRFRSGVLDTGITGVMPDAATIARAKALADPVVDVIGAHGLVAGFSTLRLTGRGADQARGLQNMVLRFPDPAAAAAAAGEMAAKDPGPAGASPPLPMPIVSHPEALATGYDLADRTHIVHSFTAHGPYVLIQIAQAADDILGMKPDLLVQGVLDQQTSLIDKFVPTPLDKMADLPLDPTGQLLAHTLQSPDKKLPSNVGAWQPTGWLHFEDDPVTAAAMFKTVGVDAIGQRRATVYQTRNEDSATQMADQLAATLRASDGIRPVPEEVRGLPRARCFERVKDWVPDTAAVSWQRILWHFKCVASADRYSFTTFSAAKEDAMQQISAQYRILAGK
jgi:hypothetical protein